MTYRQIWVGFCPKCNSEFGHIKKGRANTLRTLHLNHSINTTELKLKDIDEHYESLLIRQNEEDY